MISAVNSVKFASTNNYKRTYTNTNQNTNPNLVSYQQSFGMKRHSRVASGFLGLVMMLAGAVGAKAESKAGKLAGKVADEAALVAKAKKVAETHPIRKNKINPIDEKDEKHFTKLSEVIREIKRIAKKEKIKPVTTNPEETFPPSPCKETVVDYCRDKDFKENTGNCSDPVGSIYTCLNKDTMIQLMDKANNMHVYYNDGQGGDKIRYEYVYPYNEDLPW